MKLRPTLPLVIIVIGLLASGPSPRAARAQQAAPGVGRGATSGGTLYNALVIGNRDYAALPKLRTAAADARAVERVLRLLYGFQTKLLVNAKRSQILAALSAYRRESDADASLLIYYAGRWRGGGEDGKAYWLPVDAAAEDATNWLSADEVTAAIRLIPARHVLVVSDGCYAGTAAGGAGVSPAVGAEREQSLQRMAAGRSRTLITSCGDAPVADDDGHSVFAAAFLRGLREMGGPRFTAFELFADHVVGRVAALAGQTPVYKPLPDSDHDGGDFVFKRVERADAAAGAADSWVCSDLETKAKHYKEFLDNSRGNPEQQKVAYESGKSYVRTYDGCTTESDKNIVAYVRNWLTKYEAAVREWERWKGRRP